LRPDPGHDAAVRMNLAHGVRRAAAAAGPHVRGAAETAPDRAGAALTRRVAAAPADLRGAHREVLRPLRVRRSRLHVAQPQLDGIDPEAIGELVDHDFGDEARLRMAGGAKRPLRTGVDVDVAM